MVKYEIINKQKGMLVTKAVKAVMDDTPKTDKKYRVRKEINEKVFDLDDSVADNSKMISLLTTVLSRIYDVLPDTEKDNLNADDRAMIEYMFSKFKTTNTRADVQFATEGVSLIDKLLDRQADIGTIVQQ